MSCDHEWTEIDSSIVCVLCGGISEENMFMESLHFDNRGLVGAFVYHDEKKKLHKGKLHVSFSRKRPPKDFIDRIGRLIGFKTEELRFCSSLYKDAVELDPHFFYGSNRELTAIVCMYLTARIKKSPVLLSHLARMGGVELNDCTGALSLIKPGLGIQMEPQDPSLYFERILNAVKLERADKFVLIELATQLAEFLENEWFSAGQKPSATAVAMIIVTLLYKFTTPDATIELQSPLQKTVPLRTKYQNKPSSELVKALSAALGILPRAIPKRIQTWRLILLEKSKNLPWKRIISYKNVFEHLPDIIRFNK